MKNEIILYQTDELPERIEVRVDEENETFWLSLNQISILFERDKSVISKHLKNIFKDDELKKNSVVAFFATTASDGKTYNVEHYNLDAINNRINRLEEKVDTINSKVNEIGLQIKTLDIPTQDVFFEGPVFYAYKLASIKNNKIQPKT